MQLIRTLEACLQTEGGPQQDMVVSKCRDVGATWVFCAVAVHDWLWEPDSIIGCISKKEEYADSPSMKSVMRKMRHILKYLPAWMQPGAKEKIDNTLLLKNLLNGNEIFGNATTPDFGVADRGSWAIFDEFAKHKHGQASWGGSSDAFDTRAAVSTESLPPTCSGDMYDALPSTSP